MERLDKDCVKAVNHKNRWVVNHIIVANSPWTILFLQDKYRRVGFYWVLQLVDKKWARSENFEAYNGSLVLATLNDYRDTSRLTWTSP